ncbi:hypothetical protein P1P68_12710 [Streptomyces scabiei]|uniref:hypothetical protein n=1 Tax=Streptomyces scabiei TaxID=1930 RepID=UPI00298F831E|nr:hypothetical protein [Streptomyces scabiei]MDW8805620.1 hypothetical protein [Streptomyces scabiei]
MTDTSEGILTVDDGALIVTSVAAAAGPGGIEKNELLRQADLISNHIADWKTGAGLYDLFRKGEIRVFLNDDETDVLIVQSGPDYPPRRTP